MKVPFLNFNETNNDKKPELMAALEETFDSGQFILGHQVAEFEKEYALIMGAHGSAGINSGTSALHLCIRCCDVGPGDEVITTPFTFMASSWCISYEKATPVFVDIDPDTFIMDPKKVEAAITAKTKAIVLVHLFGQPAPMDEYLAIAKRHNLKLIEDCAQSHLSQYKGTSTGLIGDCGAFSFYPTKNLGGLGEGGLFVSKNEDMLKRAKLLRNHAMPDRYTYEDVGYNYRMEGFSGAVLRVKLKYLQEWTIRRQEIGAAYQSRIKLPGVKLPPIDLEAPSVYHQYTITYELRDALVNHLAENDIATGMFYPNPLHLQPVYSELGYKEGSLPFAEAACKTVVNLPIYPEMTDEQVTHVIDTVNSF